MSATRAKSRAQQIYDLAAKGIESVRYAENVLEDQGDTCHHSQDMYPTFLRQVAAYRPTYEEQFGMARAELERRHHGEAALLYCARSSDGKRAGLPADICTKIAAKNNTPAAWDNALKLPRGMGLYEGEGTKTQPGPGSRAELRSSSQAGCQGQAGFRRQTSSSGQAGSGSHTASPRQSGNRGFADTAQKQL